MCAIKRTQNAYQPIFKLTPKFFNKARGWGFIKADDGAEYFVHYSQVQMDGFKTLNADDIVSFEVSEPDENNRIQAVNVQPILTLAMVMHELKKEKLHIMRIRDDKGIHGWYVFDKSDHLVIDKEMDLLEVAEFAGFEIIQASA